MYSCDESKTGGAYRTMIYNLTSNDYRVVFYTDINKTGLRIITITPIPSQGLGRQNQLGRPTKPAIIRKSNKFNFNSASYITTCHKSRPNTETFLLGGIIKQTIGYPSKSIYTSISKCILII